MRWITPISEALAMGTLAMGTLAGCGGSQGTVLGSPPQGAPQPVAAVQTKRLASRVTLQGEMVERCPVAGCWFNIHDKTGTIKVDTKNAGFVTLAVPLHSQVTVEGRIVKDGSDRMLDATGLRY